MTGMPAGSTAAIFAARMAATQYLPPNAWCSAPCCPCSPFRCGAISSALDKRGRDVVSCPTQIGNEVSPVLRDETAHKADGFCDFLQGHQLFCCPGKEEIGMLTSLGLVLLLGMALGALAKRLNLPALVGMLIAGMILGPYALDLLSDSLLNISADLRRWRSSLSSPGRDCPWMWRAQAVGRRPFSCLCACCL